MKTDLSPSALPTPPAPTNGVRPLPAGARPGMKPPMGSPDYKVDLSSTAKTPSAPSTASAPSVPSAPTAPSPSKLPDLPKFRTPAEEAAKSKAESTVKEEAVKKSAEAATAEKKSTKGTVQKPAIVFISGLQMMYSPSKSEGSYAGLGRIAETVEGARMYGWDQSDEILEHIATTHPSQPVVLVGHSLGGDTAVDVANRLDSLEHGFRKVDLLVSLDAVGFNNDIIPQNVKEHLNVFGESDWVFNDGPHVARRHDKTQVKNILSPLDHTELDDAKDVQFEIVSSIKARLGRPA